MKKSNHEPTTDVPAIAEPAVLQEFDRLKAVLTETHVSIPSLLVRERNIGHALGSTPTPELQRQLSGVTAEREDAARRRVASTIALLGMESLLTGERMTLEQERRNAAAAVSEEFREEWQMACHTLEALRVKAQTLGAALHCVIPTPAPYIAVAIPGGDDAARKLQPVGTSEPAPAALPLHLAELAARLDRIDAALAVVNTIKANLEFDRRHYALAVLKNAPTEFRDTYKVLMPFPGPDGSQFEPGMLIDSSLMGPGMLYRLQVGRRHITPVSLESAVA